MFEAENPEINEDGNELLTWHRIPTTKFANLTFEVDEKMCLYDHETAIFTATAFNEFWFEWKMNPTDDNETPMVKPPLVIQEQLLDEDIKDAYDVYPDAFSCFDRLTAQRPWLWVLNAEKAKELEEREEAENAKKPQKRKKNKKRNKAKK